MQMNTTITRRGEGGDEGKVGGDRNRKGKIAQSRLTFPKRGNSFVLNHRSFAINFRRLASGPAALIAR